MASSGAPWPWGLQPPYYPSPLERGEGDSLPLGLEGEGRSWGGGGGRGAPWRPHEWEEKQRGGEPQTPPSMEGRGGGRGSCEASQDMVGRKTAWGPPRVEETEERGSWRPTTRGPQEPPREYWSPEQEGREDSCEPPQKRFRSPPVGEWQRIRLNPPKEDPWESLQKKVQSPSPMEGWWRIPLSPPRERGSTSASSQRQPSTPSSHAPHWEPLLPRSSGWDSPSTGGNPWVSQDKSDGPETGSWVRSRELLAHAWEPCGDLEMPPPPASRGAMEERDLGRSKWLEEPASGSSSSHQRSRGDPGWGTRPGNPVNGSYSVKAGGNGESWSGTGFQTFQSQIDSREQDNIIASPRESAPQLPELNADQLEEEASLELWHRRFGHVDSAVILRLQSSNLVTGIKVGAGEAGSTARCLTCLAVKGEESAFSINAVSRSTRFMDLVHCELSGPFDVPALELQRYVLIFVDDYSRWCFTFALKETSETHGYFEKYLANFTKREKPKAFQMNSAADSISPQTLALLKKRGISHKRGVECIPGQSRTAKREMECLLEMTRCMLADANLPGPFWGHAIFTATHLWNRLAVSCGKTTPIQAWSGKVPRVNRLRVFGSLVCDRREPKDPTQNIIIGYKPDLLHYRVINLQTGRLHNKKFPLDFDEQRGVLRKGNFLAAIEKIGSNIQPFTVTSVSMTPEPELHKTVAGGEMREARH